MGLVDYDSDSGSDSDSVAPQPAPAPKTTTSTSTGAAPAPTEAGVGAAGKKKVFQKLIDRSDPKKIKVNLPDAKRGAGDEPPPAKRARTAGGGGVFGGFNSMLPAPKNPAKGASAAAGGWAAGKAVGAGGLKTGSERGFVRDGGAGGGGEVGGGEKGPEIPEGMKREDVKLVGKPLMFRPLSVARKAATKKGAAKKGISPAAPAKTGAALPPPTPVQEAPKAAPEPQEELSLFSLPSAEDDAPTADPHPHIPLYPLSPEADPSPLPDWTAHHQQQQEQEQEQQTVSSLAQDLNLSRTAHRDLFGRGAAPDADFLTFDLSKEYSRNEVLRQSGELAQPQRPVRAAIQGGGKHSLKQLVNAVAGQREVLEEGFAKGKEKRRDAGGRYGWR
ncbi:uncharacterized protein DNG_05466 [Cephalotrichum gorgonifer]|uniref:Mitotic checkpoint regulator, MAD2B-interacting-domain-containing protein n=1 Tax=Cephalotrichum gorgonifer TaxID=2041049 RepID=A0AAE8SVI3_9PEZI|nr:uncharacterized protein DNG_05466 [Cephalotrichum gorgonifer]